MRTLSTRGLSAAIVVAGALALSSRGLAAQVDELWPLAAVIQAGRKSPRPGEVIGRVEVVGRASYIDGDVEPAMDLHYQDLFQSGLGAGVEGSVLVRSEGWYLGGYVSVGWDSFPGKKNTDDFGDSLEPDRMDIVTVLVGFKSLYDLGHGFFADTHVGLGAALYRSVSGTLTLSGVPMEVEVFKSTTAFAFDVGARFGYAVERFFFDLGLGVRIQGPPDNGDLNFDSSGPAIITLEVGVGLKF